MLADGIKYFKSLARYLLPEAQFVHKINDLADFIEVDHARATTDMFMLCN